MTVKGIAKVLPAVLAGMMLLIAASLSGADRNYSFLHINSQKGLSASNVKAIVRDPLGFIWLGTKNGLNRYDGHDMKLYNVFDANIKRGNNNIGALYFSADSILWVGTDRGIFKYNSHSDRFSYMDGKAADGTGAHNWVMRIDGDKEGNIWALLPDLGIFRIKGDKVWFYQLKSERFKEAFYSDICVDGSGVVWAATTKDGIFRYDKASDSFKKAVSTGDGPHYSFCRIIDGGDGSLIAASSDGYIYRVMPSSTSGMVTNIPLTAAGDLYVRDIAKFDNELWVATQGGLVIKDLANGEEMTLQENPANEFSISDNTIYCIYRDQENSAWLGTMFGGADYMSRRPFRFMKYGIENGLSGRRVRGMTMGPEGTLVVGTEDAGINMFNTWKGYFTPVGGSPSKTNTVVCITNVKGNIYTGFQRYGLFKTTLPSGFEQTFYNTAYSDNSVYCYLVDSWGTEWVGSGFSLYRRDAGEKEFRRVEETGFDWVFALKEGSDGILWIGTMGNGLYRYDRRKNKFTLYTHKDENPKEGELGSNSINDIMEDSSGTVWISTDRGGLNRYNKDQDNFTVFGKEQGLPDDVVYSVLEDNHRNLWFGTNRGLCKLNPATGQVKVFTTADGLPSNQFSYNSAVAHPSGRFYFGTVNGIVAFDPDLESSPAAEFPLYFTSLNLLDKEVNVGEDNSPLQVNMLYTKELKLPYDKSSFTLSVASPNFGNLGKDIYRYRLLPVSKEWVEMANNKISFTNLAPGKYTLEVKLESEGKEIVKSLKIVITPPWWKSWWATSLYAILGLLILVFGFVWYKRHRDKSMQEREQRFSMSKEKELYRNKVNFFTEIAHEIRTPLSLIDIPLEAMEDIDLKDPSAKKYVRIMRQNTSRLLQLTNQLLDFQKIDASRLTLKPENVNVTELLNHTVDRFEPTMNLSGKTIVRHIPDAQVRTCLDKEALTKILSNLLNNALKYSRREIIVTLEVDEKTFSISVASDGVKIAADEREKIFEPFYQTKDAKAEKNGVGIGLPLSRSLAVLLSGSLTLKETADDMNVFVVTLPLNAVQAVETPVIDAEKESYLLEEESNQTKERSDGYVVLLVEDNDSIRRMLSEQLGSHFFVETARDGGEALERLGDHPVDIVVTDVMMPGMDGMELCKRIKENADLSHLPVVFITAKNDMESKIKGIQAGAEAYIEKPFSVKYLRQLIYSLLDNRRRERESFSKKPFFNVDNMQMNKADEEFMNKVIETIHQHISEEDFNVETLTDILCMSRSNLLRKIKSIFNLSPLELIRIIRLKRAAELIREGKYRIGEICQMVGINSPSYFSKLFFKQFNVSPKDFAQQCQKQSASGETIINS